MITLQEFCKQTCVNFKGNVQIDNIGPCLCKFVRLAGETGSVKLYIDMYSEFKKCPRFEYIKNNYEIIIELINL